MTYAVGIVCTIAYIMFMVGMMHLLRKGLEAAYSRIMKWVGK